MDLELQIPQQPRCIPDHAACKPERSAGFSWVEFVRFSMGCRKETDKTMEDEKDFMIFLDSWWISPFGGQLTSVGAIKRNHSGETGTFDIGISLLIFVWCIF